MLPAVCLGERLFLFCLSRCVFDAFSMRYQESPSVAAVQSKITKDEWMMELCIPFIKFTWKSSCGSSERGDVSKCSID